MTEDSAIWIGVDGWYAHNNTSNRRDLVRGSDDTITIPDAVPPATATVDGSTIAWDWPDVANDADVYGYREPAIGQVPWNPLPGTFDHFAVQVDDIVDLTLDFDLNWTPTGPDDDFNISVSLWLTSDPDGDVDAVRKEVAIWLRKSNRTPEGNDTGITDALVPTISGCWKNRPKPRGRTTMSGISWSRSTTPCRSLKAHSTSTTSCRRCRTKD